MKAETEILMQLSELSLELMSVFKEASSIFLFHNVAKKCKNHLRMYRMYCFNFIGLQQNIHLVAQSL
jgi:hypothetical protein